MDGRPLKAGICEDNAVQQRYLERLLLKWGEERGCSLQVSAYASCEAFWFDWCEAPDFDILLLDIDLGREGISGIELAKRIRKTDERLIIVFITALPEYISQGYDVQAFHYLIKPVEERKLKEILDSAARRVSRREECLMLEGETEVRLIPVSRILYAEAFSHSTALYLTEGQGHVCQELKKGMKEIEERLPLSCFFRCHRSYLVNLMHIRKICRNQVFLSDKTVLPVSRSRDKKLYQAFLAYHKQAEDLC